jgi:transposase
MTKYNIEERLTAAQAVETGESIANVAIRSGISEQVIRRTLGIYQKHGRIGLSNKSHDWSIEQKYQVLAYMHENNLSCQETSIQFGINGSSTVWTWEQKYLENGIGGLENKKKGRHPKRLKQKPSLTREEKLQAENEYLRAENEYLKKLNALVAEREKRERRTE